MINDNKTTVDEDLQNRFNFLMNAKLTPYGKQKGSRGNKEGLKMMGKFSPRSYPRHLVLDKDKFIYLRELLGRNEVSDSVFVDLATVLSIRRDKIVQALQDYYNNKRPELKF